MTKRVSQELKAETARIYQNSVDFWRENKEICRHENALAREKAEKRWDEERLRDQKDRFK